MYATTARLSSSSITSPAWIATPSAAIPWAASTTRQGSRPRRAWPATQSARPIAHCPEATKFKHSAVHPIFTFSPGHLESETSPNSGHQAWTLPSPLPRITNDRSLDIVQVSARRVGVVQRDLFPLYRAALRVSVIIPLCPPQATRQLPFVKLNAHI